MTAPAIAQAPVGRPMSLEDWADMPEDDDGEIVDGLLTEEEVPSIVHEIIVLWIGSMLRAWAAPRGGFVGASGGKFRVRANRGRKPDVFAYLGGRRPEPRGLVTVPPDIAVEVVSPSPSDGRRDRVEKFDEYAAFGVRWYWLVDPAIRSVEVHELADGCYRRVLGATEGEVQIPGCEGLGLDLGALWAEVDRLEADGPDGTR